MTPLLVVVAFVVGAVGGSLITHHRHRQHTCELEDAAAMTDWFRDAADRLVDQLDTAEHALRHRRARRGAP